MITFLHGFFHLECSKCKTPTAHYDGHASHLSIDVIEKARSNDIHLLSIPAHCTHILQPLDVSVMGSLKNCALCCIIVKPEIKLFVVTAKPCQ